ncbi:hypothetical protein CGMCC3_g6187 [Colletotrichum fructicola]|nr:uncharacterized protein CGMCC3_g6187 [Colletotrichum fructicola]KAE9577882.1 hypothetical protein CGMCC3_g6187 [Colletotrichum fructicola]
MAKTYPNSISKSLSLSNSDNHNLAKEVPGRVQIDTTGPDAMNLLRVHRQPASVHRVCHTTTNEPTPE